MVIDIIAFLHIILFSYISLVNVRKSFFMSPRYLRNILVALYGECTCNVVYAVSISFIQYNDCSSTVYSCYLLVPNTTGERLSI